MSVLLCLRRGAGGADTAGCPPRQAVADFSTCSSRRCDWETTRRNAGVGAPDYCAHLGVEAVGILDVEVGVLTRVELLAGWNAICHGPQHIK